MPSSLLIVGATGVIGKHITRAIINSKSSFGRIGILTSPSTLEKKASEISTLKNEGVNVLTGDLANEKDVKQAYHGFDTVISCVGRGAIETQIKLIQWASESKIKRFFPSEYGTDVEYSPASAHEKPHQLKLKVRAYAKTVEDVEFTYLVTGPYSDMFIGKAHPDEIGSYDVKARKAVLLADGKAKISFTTMADVGKLVVACLLHPDASRNAILKVNSFTTSMLDILHEYEKQTDTEWKVSYTSLDVLKKREQEMWAQGSPTATSYTLKRIWVEGGTLYEERDNGKIGNPRMETLEEQVRQSIERQTRGSSL